MQVENAKKKGGKKPNEASNERMADTLFCICARPHGSVSRSADSHATLGRARQNERVRVTPAPNICLYELSSVRRSAIKAPGHRAVLISCD